MPNIEIAIGTEVTQIEEQIIKIKIPHSKFSIIGEKTEKKKWNIFIWDPDTQKKESIRKNVTTTAFSLFSNIVLKSPFPYEGKEITLEIIKSYIKKINKKNGKQHNNSRSINR